MARNFSPSLAVDRILLPEADLFGQHWTAKDFIDWLARQSRKKREAFVRNVLDHYGLTSSEFYFVIQVMVIMLLVKYGYTDDDVFQNCVVKILDVVRHFDSTKGKLTSFIHCIVKDRVALARYHDRREHFVLVSLPESFLNEEGDLSSSSPDDIASLIDFSSQMRLYRSREDLCRMLSGDTVYRRVWNWRTTAGQL
jgi:hypothetical protein